MLKIGQRWRHIYDGINNGHHDYHNFVVEIIAIEDERVKCKIVQIVVNNNQTWHSASKLADEYFVKTIPRSSDYVEGANSANTWMLLHGQDRSEMLGVVGPTAPSVVTGAVGATGPTGPSNLYYNGTVNLHGRSI